jgi:hypothetical protein
MSTRNQPIDPNCWPVERQGYSDVPRAAYAAVRTDVLPPPRRRRLSIHAEVRIANLIMVIGIIWIARIAMVLGSIDVLRIVGALPPGALEITGIGALIWLHAKWRHSVNLN